MQLRSRFLHAALVLCCVAVAGCAPRPLPPSGKPDAPVRYTLESLPAKEVWTGLVFNGAKVGFTHTRVAPLAQEPGHFEIASETALLLRFLGFEKRIFLKSRDIVREDLTLERFDAEYLMDGNALALHGVAKNGRLVLGIDNAGKRTDSELGYAEPLYPVSALAIYPLRDGLEVGRRYRYLVFNGETQQIAEVVQRVAAFERGELFRGEAYRVENTLQGQKATLWIDTQGRPLLEIGLNGAMIAGLEDEREAKGYLTAAGLNQQDVITDFSLVRTERAIAAPANVVRMKVELDGVDLALPSGPGQRCERSGSTWRCELDAGLRAPADGDATTYLRSSVTVPYLEPAIRTLAGEIAPNSRSDEEKMRAILDWLEVNIRKQAADAFSALDVLASRRAECQGHSYLYAALARASGIPTRVVNGLVYSESHQGFLYHTWTESLIDGEWRAIDPTFGQPSADATHVKLVEGEDFGALVPLTDLLGKIGARVIAFEYAR